MRVDETWQKCGLTEINDWNTRRYPDLTLRSDIGDALTHDEHYLFGRHLAADGVEEAAGTNGNGWGRRGTLQDAPLGIDAGPGPSESPGLGRALPVGCGRGLRLQQHRPAQCTQACRK